MAVFLYAAIPLDLHRVHQTNDQLMHLEKGKKTIRKSLETAFLEGGGALPFALILAALLKRLLVDLPT